LSGDEKESSRLLKVGDRALFLKIKEPDPGGDVCPKRVKGFEDGVEPGLFFGSVGSGRFIGDVKGIDPLGRKGFGKSFPEFGINGFIRGMSLDETSEVLRGNPDVFQEDLVERAIVGVFSEGPGIMGPGLVDDSLEMVDAVQPVDRASGKGLSQVHGSLLAWLYRKRMFPSPRKRNKFFRG
jgi:hypothetical protein